MKKTVLMLFMLLGAIAARAQTTGVPGTPVPCCGTQILGTDGTNSRGIKTDSSGVVQTASTPPSGASATQVQGTAANGAGTVGNPVWICGLNGGNCVALLVDSSGRVILGAGAQTIGAVTQASGPWTTNMTQVAGQILGALSNYGTSPGAVLVESVNSFITNVPAVNQTQVAGATLGAPSNYGTSPGAVTVPGVNAFVTNTPAVTQSGGPWTVNHTQTAGSTLGAISNYGTSPGAVAVESVNAFITNTPSVTIGANSSVNVAQIAGTTTSVNSGTVDAGTQRHVLATNVAIPIGGATVSQTMTNGSMAAVDTAGTARPLGVAQFPFDGTNSVQARSASLANEAPSSGAFTPPTGLQMMEKGPRWVVTNTGATSGSQGTTSIAAAASKRHVVDCIAFSADSAAAVVATNVTINVRDGATGAGTVIWFYAVSFPTASALGVQEINPVSFCGLNLIGTTNTAMTLEFSAGVTGSIQAVNMSGYDIN